MPSLEEDAESLRAAMLQRCKTIYAFCGLYGLPRGTVYQVLRGKYAGDAEKQIARIWRIIEAGPTGSGAGPGAQALQKALAAVACQHCEHGKRRCRKRRPQCKKLWTAQAAALSALLEVPK